MQTAVIVTNETRIIQKARKGLSMVHEGENKTMEGWLLYGAALNEGREMFPSNEQFGKWVSNNLLGTENYMDRSAAMWAAANPEDFKAVRKANPRVPTVRGLHAKWKAPSVPKPALQPTEDDLKTMGRLKNLAERGATEGERSAAQAKLDAYSSAFGDQKEEVIEKATEAAQAEQDREPDSVIIQKFHNRLKRKDQDWLIDQLLWAMHRDHEIFKTIAERLFEND